MSQWISGLRGLVRAALLLAATVLGLGLFAGSASADTPPPIGAGANWQATVNFYRAMAVLPGVNENTTWSSEDEAHACYTAENGFAAHEEIPGNPCYSPGGHTAAQNGNVAIFFGFPSVSCPDRKVVELWMAGPFHAVGIVDPKLQTSGFGSAINTGSTPNPPGTVCGATLDVLRGLSGSAPTSPVFFPAHATTTPLLQFTGNEFPNPWSHCGYSGSSGPAILLQPPSNPISSSATVKDNGTTVASCSFDENTYSNPGDPGLQSLGRAVLAGRHAVVVMTQAPYTSGHLYTVSVQVTGGTVASSPESTDATHTWSFFACQAGQNGGSCNGPTAVHVRKANAVRTQAGVLLRWRTASEAQTLGFNVYRQRHGRPVKLNRTLIPSVFGGTATGHAYSWLDRKAPRAGRSLTYRLQAVRLDGTRRWIGTVALGS